MPSLVLEKIVAQYALDGVISVTVNVGGVFVGDHEVAVVRRNWLFIGSIAAGERAADFITVVSSAVRNDLDVFVYVKDVLDQLLAGTTDYETLRPDRWAEAHPESIRQYRRDERRDRADAKQARRAQRRALNAKKP